jgi:O-antigen/teichoic acid export membrane protein
VRRRNLARTVASAAQAVAPAASGVISLAAVRTAGVETWGGFLAAMVLVNLVAQVAAFGSREHLLRAFSRDPSGIRSAWQRNVAARAWLLLPGPCVFLAAGWSLGATALLVAWLAGVFVTRSHDPVIAYRRAFTVGLAIELGATAATTAAILALGGSLTVEALIAIHAAVAVGRAGILAAWFGVAAVPRRLPRLDIPELRAGWRFFALTFSGAVQSRVDLYVVAALLPAAALGEYGVLTGFVAIGQSLAAAVLTPIVPALYRLPRSRVVRVAVRTVAFGVPVTLAGTGAIWLGLELLYGIDLPRLAVAAAAAAMLPCFLYTPLVYLRFRDGREDAVIAISLLGLVVSLVGTLALAPQLGIAGAMLAAAFGQVAIAGGHVILTLRPRPRPAFASTPGSGS